jgi:hypothetical protein
MAPVLAMDAVKIAVVIGLCAPAVIGAIVLWALGAGVLPERVAGAAGSWPVHLFLMAAYGPVLVIFASIQAIHLSRRANDMRLVYAAWAAVAVALAAAVGFWQFGIDTAPTP